MKIAKNVCQIATEPTVYPSQGLVTFLEAKYDPGGLDLTRATLDGLVK